MKTVMYIIIIFTTYNLKRCYTGNKAFLDVKLYLFYTYLYNYIIRILMSFDIMFSFSMLFYQQEKIFIFFLIYFFYSCFQPIQIRSGKLFFYPFFFPFYTFFSPVLPTLFVTTSVTYKGQTSIRWILFNHVSGGCSTPKLKFV